MGNGWGKRAGGVLVAAFGVGAIGIGLALALNWSAGETFSPWTNYISDLSVGSRGSNIVFVVVMVLLAALTGYFFMVTAAPLKRAFGPPKAVNIARALGIVWTLDVFVMVCFPLDPTRPRLYSAHIVTGIIVFVCMAAYLESYSLVFRSREGLFRAGSVVSGVGAACAFVFAVLLFLTESVHPIPPMEVTYLLEWAALVALAIWMLLTGLQLRKRDPVP